MKKNILGETQLSMIFKKERENLMLMKLRSRMQNQKGFTLVELMVVVVILGILVAIAVPVYNSVSMKAEKSAVKANLRTIDGAIMQYKVINETDTTVTAAEVGALLQNWPTGPKGVTYGLSAEGTTGGVAIITDKGTTDWTPTALKANDTIAIIKDY